MQTYHLFCTKKTTFFILHTHFYKTPTSVHLLYTIFYINNIFIFFFNIILSTVSFSYTSSSFFFLISLSFPLSFLPLLFSSFSHGQNPKAPEQAFHQHHNHHKHHNASPIHRSPSTQKHYHEHSINTDLRQATKPISINTNLHHQFKLPLQSTIHDHRSNDFVLVVDFIVDFVVNFLFLQLIFDCVCGSVY